MNAFILQIFYRSVLFSLGYGLWLLYKRCCFGRRNQLPIQFQRMIGILCMVWLAAPLTVPVTFHYTVPAQFPTELSTKNVEQTFRFETCTPAAFQKHDASVCLADIIVFIWLIGFSASVLFHLAAYIHMLRRLHRWRTSLFLQGAKCPEEGRFQNVRIGYTLSASIPLVSGLVRPIIWIPESWRERDTALKSALLHEITHVRQGDLWVKWLLMWVKSLYWFHPAVFAFARQISKALEFACDERALKDASLETRREYSAAILIALKQEEHQKSSFGFLGLWEEENQVLSRIRQIMKPKGTQGVSKGKIRVILGILAALTLTSVIEVQGVAIPSENTPSDRSLDKKTDLQSVEPVDIQMNSALEGSSEQITSSAAVNTADDSKENTEVRFHLILTNNPGSKGGAFSYPMNEMKSAVEYELKNEPCQSYRVAFPSSYECLPDLVRNELLFYANPGTEVYAIADEVVTDAGQVPFLGKCVSTESGGYEIVYSHLEEINVEIGDTLKQGELIGLVGTTGAVKHYMCGLRIDSKDGFPADLSEYASGFEW